MAPVRVVTLRGAARAGDPVAWNASWNHKPAQPRDFSDPKATARDVCPAREAGTTEQATFNPLVQGSTPWRPTPFDLRFLPGQTVLPVLSVAFQLRCPPRLRPRTVTRATLFTGATMQFNTTNNSNEYLSVLDEGSSIQISAPGTNSLAP
jgi:hypothetical protein